MFDSNNLALAKKRSVAANNSSTIDTAKLGQSRSASWVSRAGLAPNDILCFPPGLESSHFIAAVDHKKAPLHLGRSMLECMEILSVAAQKRINVYAVKGAWRLERV
jgi:hypothetical protein